MRRIVCWWRGHHDWSDWRPGVIFNSRVCQTCSKQQHEEV